MCPQYLWNYTTLLEHFLRGTPDPLPRFARLERNLTLGRAKRKGVGGKEFLPALAFRRRRISSMVLVANISRELIILHFQNLS